MIFILSVNQPPTFTRVPEPMEVVEGSMEELVCRAKGNPAPKLTWFKDKKHLKEDQSISFETYEEGNESESKCLISDVSLAHDGKYAIEAANEFGKITAEVSVTGITKFMMFMMFIP